MIERSDELVTIFGGAGFIGRYVTECLLRSGVRVRIASRDPRRDYFIQPLAQVGQFGFVPADISHKESVDHAIKDATSVINLCGTFGRAMHAVHVEGARNVAEAARKHGLASLVHISAINVAPDAPSNYGRTKSEGEAAVRKAFKNATIIRPSLVFGAEDLLTNRFAAMAQFPVLPVVAAQRKFQPVYVRDLAQAIATAALEPGKAGGKIFEIGGPQVLTMVELHRAIIEITGQTPAIVELPDFVGSLFSRFGWIPGAPMTRDQWLMLTKDNVAAKEAPGLEALGIKPTPLAAVGNEWLSRFSGNRFTGRRRTTAAS